MEPGRGAADGPVLIFSDVHLDPAEPDKTAAFVRFCERMRPGGFAYVYCLGDLFHYWVGPGQEGLPEVAEPLAALGALAAGGTRLVLLHGNRDFHLGAEVRGWLGAGAAIVAGPLRVCHLGLRLHLEHGDLLCARDTRYRAMRRVIRHRAAVRAFRALPLRWRLAVASGLRALSRRELARKSGPVLALCGALLRRRVAGPIDAAVIGHVHRAQRREAVVQGRRRWVFSLGAWDHGNRSWLEIDREQIVLHDGPQGRCVLRTPAAAVRAG
ncbi:MAG: UDP-2,3-diacylglucosamine hydrolase [Planctomycetota bacterium]|nr:MAG: UDP-2,3-diacylglucosamine hydrolase [Planctomycetota bacterium]